MMYIRSHVTEVKFLRNPEPAPLPAYTLYLNPKSMYNNSPSNIAQKAIILHTFGVLVQPAKVAKIFDPWDPLTGSQQPKESNKNVRSKNREDPKP